MTTDELAGLTVGQVWNRITALQQRGLFHYDMNIMEAVRLAVSEPQPKEKKR